jgi:hypothetical protein
MTPSAAVTAAHPLAGTPRLSRHQTADLHFMDARAKLLDLAAFLDRLDRATGPDDHRVRGLRRALPLLLGPDAGRVAAILDLWSDPTPLPAEKADTKSASGVWPGLE